MTARRSSWTRRALVAVLTLNLLLAGGALLLRSQDAADPVSVDSALQRFRSTPTTEPTYAPPTTAMTASPPTNPAQVPPSTNGEQDRAIRSSVATPAPDAPNATAWRPPKQGVYVYDTEGYEETDALGGARHDYPKQTTVTVRTSGCGITQRWDVFEQRSDTTELCTTPGGATTIAGMDVRHEFYGQKDHTTSTCEPGSIYQPARDVAPGTSWTYRCASQSDTSTTTATLVGRETVQVGGTSVEALHIRQRTTAGGASSGSIDRNLWLAADNGLLIRDRSQVRAATQRGAIRATYSETYEIRLTSLRPHS